MSKQWFIMSVFTGKEEQVTKTFDAWRESDKPGHEYIGETLLPMSVSDKSLVAFPGYVFAELDVFEDFMKGIKRLEIWNAVCKIEGMIGFLGGDNPRPMSEDEIASVRKYLEQKAEKKVEFKEGDSVKILDGAFAGNIGTIVKIVDGVATVNVEIFGEETEQEISVGSLEKVEDTND